MNIYPNAKLISVLKRAYAPRCPHFSSHGGSCPESTWEPQCGHVPRGFLGATGALEEVRVVMVLAEPGNPQHSEEYDSNLDSEGMLKSTVKFVHQCYDRRCGKLHSHARWFLDCLYPKLEFEEQLRRVWITESRLCSLNESAGQGRLELYWRCEDHYLAEQLKLLSHADVVAFGGKARATVRRLRKRQPIRQVIEAFALSPRPSQLDDAHHSWEDALRELRKDAL